MMATPGAHTATSGPWQVNAGEKMPSAATNWGRRLDRSQVFGCASPRLPTAATANAFGDRPG